LGGKISPKRATILGKRLRGKETVANSAKRGKRRGTYKLAQEEVGQEAALKCGEKTITEHGPRTTREKAYNITTIQWRGATFDLKDLENPSKSVGNCKKPEKDGSPVTT